MLFECLEEADKVLEAIALTFFQLHLYWGGSADLQIKDGVLEVNNLIYLCLGQFFKVLRLDLIV